MTPAPAAAPSLDELRRSYHAAVLAGGGTAKDPKLAHALIEGLEQELKRLQSKLGRSGTVYRAPKVPKP